MDCFEMDGVFVDKGIWFLDDGSTDQMHDTGPKKGLWRKSCKDPLGRVYWSEGIVERICQRLKERMRILCWKEEKATGRPILPVRRRLLTWKTSLVQRVTPSLG